MILHTTDPVTIFWFRRDLRIDDNIGLYHALKSGHPVLPLFIFDEDIVRSLPEDDARISFIYEHLVKINKRFVKEGSGLLVKKGMPLEVFKQVCTDYTVGAVYANRDYEPYARERDDAVKAYLGEQNIPFLDFKDQVIFDRGEVVKGDGTPYTVYTPYSRRWFDRLAEYPQEPVPSEDHPDKLIRIKKMDLPELDQLGFKPARLSVPEFNLNDELVNDYSKNRDYPAMPGTSHIGPYLRFGILGIRKLVQQVRSFEPTYLKELVWREFFMQILYHFPKVVDQSFRPVYDRISWINDESDFERWKEGKTGFPIVDAGMRELKTTGYMHNRVRMVTASFLCKHLLIDWRWGEAWFARNLLDYELASNNGNWQWAAGTGCDASPYFRVFNPESQQKKFDAKMEYVRKWIPELGSDAYPKPIVEHKMARERAIRTYREAVSK
jgi:deoxyribodipyrimidine photo-lyase